MKTPDQLFTEFKSQYEDLKKIEMPAQLEKAYLYAKDKHSKQFRHSGDPYIIHPLEVTNYILNFGLDDASLVAGLLHDTVEDTDATIEDIETAFGSEVAQLVEGLTKLDKIKFDNPVDAQAANMQKLIVSVANDIRVLIIKLADRMHNIQTLGPLRESKKERIARETLDIYAPLAHRLGMFQVKNILEDASFQVLYPERFAEIERLTGKKDNKLDKVIALCIAEAQKCIEEAGIVGEVTGREKHYWSIYEKMMLKGKSFDEIYDLLGIRILVSEVKDCYAVLGAIHGLWAPIPGRFKDYISTPKFNLYQSLHATVLGPQGKTIEVQIRTFEMHERAEKGVAAHWGYKDSGGKVKTKDVEWVNRLAQWKEEEDPSIYLQSVKEDLSTEEIFVFTPQGKIIPLPTGACPIDFAYAIHSEVGNRCVGAKINGKLSGLSTKLQDGDQVEILTAQTPNNGPSKDWLAFVVTARARGRIKNWFTKERREDSIDIGEAIFVETLKQKARTKSKVEIDRIGSRIAASLGKVDLEELYLDLGEKRTSLDSLQRELVKFFGGDVTKKRTRPKRLRLAKDDEIHVEGLQDVFVTKAKCCSPAPGDSLIGLTSRTRGIVVHRISCSNVPNFEEERLVAVEWVTSGEGVVALQVEALDRPYLLGDLSDTLSNQGINIIRTSIEMNENMIAKGFFEFSLADTSHLDEIIIALMQLDGVYRVSRINPSN